MDIVNHPFIKIGHNDIPRVALPVTIINPHTNKRLRTYGIIDTGADECAFPADFAAIVGHNLQKGHPKKVKTGNGETIAYAHTVCLQVYDFTIKDVLIDFLPNLSISLLGVKSFLSKFLLTIDYPKFTFSLKS
ncbi:MAG: hypothetical protein PHR44_06480 [Candidatus Omnitrophica bacterium]|nr:hypothetical protein [Candidatus Omnitrophota bacterium]